MYMQETDSLPFNTTFFLSVRKTGYNRLHNNLLLELARIALTVTIKKGHDKLHHFLVRNSAESFSLINCITWAE